jgi:predicted transcriptional regulator
MTFTTVDQLKAAPAQKGERHMKMTAEQFAEAVQKLAGSYDNAAELLGIGRRSVVRYANNDAQVPEYLRRLIVMMMKHGVPKDFRAP